jgi:hypothetical protein
MKVQQLMEMLEECDPNAEVRYASQPSYPFENSITELLSWDKETMLDAEIEGIERCIKEDGEEPMSYEEIKALAKDNLEHEGGCYPVVYLAEGSQIGYLPEGPTEALGW